MNVTTVGNVCIDRNTTEHASYTAAGGPAMFMSRVYKQFPDVSHTIISPYGVDFLQHSKDIRLFPKDPSGNKTLLYENIVQGTTRTQKAYNVTSANNLSIGEKEDGVLQSSDIVYFAPLVAMFPRDFVRSITSRSKKALKILLPQGYFREIDSTHHVKIREFVEAGEYLSHFDIVIVSDEDADDIESLVRDWSYITQIIMTRGDRGATHFRNGETIHVDTKKVNATEIVDSVGSGDIFSASFGYTYFRTKNIKESIQFANSIARQCLFYPAENIHFNINA